MKKIIALLALLATCQTIHSLQQSPKQLARLTPQARQAFNRSFRVQPRASAPASWQPSAMGSRAIATLPEAASSSNYEQSWRQRQWRNAAPSFADKILYASPLITIGVLEQSDGRTPLTLDQTWDIVHEHAKEVIEQMRRYDAVQFSWLPGYIIKRKGVKRRNGAENLRSCIAENNLDLLVVPQKMPIALFDSEGHRHELCVCERIEGTHEGRVNEAQMRQLITLLEKVECLPQDLKDDNVMFTKDGRIAFIDTESSWPCKSSSSEEHFLCYLVHKLNSLPYIFSLEPAAAQLLEKKIESYKR